MTYSMGAVVVDENEVEVCHGRSVTKTTQVSKATMQKVDHEIRAISDQQYTVARKIIEENRDKMEAMTAALLEWETIDADQINDIMEGRAPRPPKDFDTPDASDNNNTPSAGVTSVGGNKIGRAHV